MTSRALAVAGGVAITTFVVLAVAVVEVLPFEFSAIVGLPVGLVGAAVAVAVVLARWAALGPRRRALGHCLAGAGYALLASAAVVSVDPPWLGGALDLPVVVGLALATGLVVAIVAHRPDADDGA